MGNSLSGAAVHGLLGRAGNREFDGPQPAVIDVQRKLCRERTGSRGLQNALDIATARRQLEWGLVLQTEAAIRTSAGADPDDAEGVARAVLERDRKGLR